MYIVKTDSAGNILWQKTYGTVGADVAYSIDQTTDGGYITTGMKAIGNDWDVWLIKTDLNGDSLWSKTYGGFRNDRGQSVEQTTDGGYIIAGYTSSFLDTIFYGAYLIKTDGNGDTLWTKTYSNGPPNTYSEGAYCVQQIQGGYILLGNGGSANGDGIFLIRTDNIGDTIWEKTYGSPSGGESGYFLRQTTDMGFILVGRSSAFNTNWIYLVKTDSVGYAPTGVFEPTHLPQGQVIIFPNPFSSSATIEISSEFEIKQGLFEVIDVYGRKKIERTIPNGTKEMILDKGNLLPGIYFLKIISESKILATGKFIIK